MIDTSELFAGQELIDENTLPDAGTEAPEAPEAPQAAPEVAPEPQHKEPTHVPLTALQEERQRRQEMKAELEQERQNRAKMEARFQELMERFTKPPVPEDDPIPAFEDDPAGHVAAITRKYENDLSELRQFKHQQEQQSAYVQQHQNVIRSVQAAEQAFAASTPDYQSVSQAFTEKEIGRYKALGLDDNQARDQVSRDFFALATMSLQQGQNPAERLYNAAKALGYVGQPQTPESAPAAPQAPARAPNGQFAKVPPATLATVGGSPKAPDEQGDLTLEQVANMTDSEFDAFWSKMAKQGKQRPTF